jgi:hypothetical protein
MIRPRASPTMAPPGPNKEPMATMRPARPASSVKVLTVLRNIGSPLSNDGQRAARAALVQ